MKQGFLDCDSESKTGEIPKSIFLGVGGGSWIVILSPKLVNIRFFLGGGVKCVDLILNVYAIQRSSRPIILAVPCYYISHLMVPLSFASHTLINIDL